MSTNDPDVVLSAGMDLAGVQAGYQELLRQANEYGQKVEANNRELLRSRRELLETADADEKTFTKNYIKLLVLERDEYRQLQKDKLAQLELWRARHVEMTTSETRNETASFETIRKKRADLSAAKLAIFEREAKDEKLAGETRVRAEEKVQDVLNKLQKKNTQDRRKQQQQDDKQDEAGGGSPGLATFLKSAGFGLMVSGRGIPGMRAIGGIAMSAGFGGIGGMIGVGVGTAITSTIRLVEELVAGYEKLGRSAFNLTSGHDVLGRQLAHLTESAELGFVPLLTAIQSKEMEVFSALDRNRDVIRQLGVDVGKIIIDFTGFAEKILMVATNSKTLDEVIQKLGRTVSLLPATAPSLFSQLGGMLTGNVGSSLMAGQMVGALYSVSQGGGSDIAAGPVGPMDTRPRIPAGMKIPDIPDFSANQSIFQREDQLQKIKNDYTRIGIELKKQAATGDREELNNAQKQIDVRKQAIEDELSGYKDIDEAEKKRQQRLNESRDAEIARIKIDALHQEFLAKEKMLGIDLQLIQAEGSLAIHKASGAGMPFNTAADVASESAARLGIVSAAGQRAIADAQAKRAGAFAELGIQRKYLGQVPPGEQFQGERNAHAKAVEEAEKAVERADEEISLARQKLINDETKEQLDGEAKVTAAKRKDMADELQANVKLIGAIMEIRIKAFQQEYKLRRQLEIELGLGGQQKVADILREGTISPGTFQYQPGGTFPISPMRNAGLPMPGTYTAGLPYVSQSAQKLADIQTTKNALELFQTHKADLATIQQGFELELKQAQSESARNLIRASIHNLKKEEVGTDAAILELLIKQRDAVEKGTPDWNKLNEQVHSMENSMIKLHDVTLNWGEKAVSTFEILAHHTNQFKAELGGAALSAGILMRSILDMKKVPLAGLQGGFDPQGNRIPSGNIGAGFKSAFSGTSNILTEGIPLAAGIVSSVIGVVQSLRTMFAKAAKEMATAIGTEVSRLEKVANQSGLLNEAITQLEAQRTKAVTDLGSKKGGQKELTTLLPQIDDALANIRAKQKEIVDGFQKALSLLDQTDPIAQVITDFDTLNSKVQEFIKAAGDSQDTYDQAFSFIEKSAAKMAGNIDKEISDANKAFFQGAEDDQGNLISLEEEAAKKKADNEKNYYDTIDKLEKQRADTIKANNKAEAADLKQITDLKQQIIDLNDAEIKQIKTISNEGIKERESTTQQDKAQRIADLQDATKKQRDAMGQQIDDILTARAERQAAFEENITNLNTAEETARHNMDNTFLRINNEMDRTRAAFLEKLTLFQQQKDKILELEDVEGRYIANTMTIWRSSLHTRLNDYTDFIDGIIAQNDRVNGGVIRGNVGNMTNAVTQVLDSVASRVQSA